MRLPYYIDKNDVLKYFFSLILIIYFIIIGIIIFAINMTDNGRKLLIETALKEKAINEANNKVMISQIKPHFLYNALNAIMAIDNNPDETIEAIGDFGEYLRDNLNILTDSKLISFEKELEHIKTYLRLEQLRFKDKLKIEYDIKENDFEVPPLCIQMLVENGVKHGITSINRDGIIKISTYIKDDNYVVVIEDNGKGFDPCNYEFDNRTHVGINNCRIRLKEYLNASLTIESKVNEGCKCIIKIPRRDNENSNNR